MSSGARSIDATNASVRVRGAQQFAVSQAGQGNVVGEAGLAGNFGARVYSAARAADYTEIAFVPV